jgi:hypothetical protein
MVGNSQFLAYFGVSFRLRCCQWTLWKLNFGSSILCGAESKLDTPRQTLCVCVVDTCTHLGSIVILNIHISILVPLLAVKSTLLDR